MSSIRLDKQIFPFFDSVKTPVTASGTSESFHNNGFGSMTIEVSGAASGEIEGCINILNADGSVKADSACSWSSLAVVNLGDLSLSSSFSGIGHYSVSISGMARVRVVLSSVSGSVTIVGVAEV